MRTLFDLLASDDGRALLAERGLYCDVDEFRSQLRPPVDGDLVQLLGLPPGARPVHIGQQVCADYSPWTLSKFAAGADLLGADDGAAPVVLWHDTYRAEAERYGMRLVVPAGTKQLGIWLAPRSLGAREPRFIPVGRPAVQEALDRLAAWVTSAAQTRPKPERVAARTRMTVLADAVLTADLETLGEVNAAFARFLLARRLGVSLPSTFLSTLLDAGLLTASVAAYLQCLDEVIVVFNEAVAELVAQDIDPQVRPLEEDYLPLHYSCPHDGQRLRLVRERRSGVSSAVATCDCGSEFRFPLGSARTGLEELAATGRWCTDVSLPVHHNAQTSGWIVGRSTALYGLVLNQVLERVLGQRPIPAWIPPELQDGRRAGDPAHSLLTAYLLGS